MLTLEDKSQINDYLMQTFWSHKTENEGKGVNVINLWSE